MKLLPLQVKKRSRPQQNNVTVLLLVHTNNSPLVLGASQAIKGSERTMVWFVVLGFFQSDILTLAQMFYL